MELKEKIDELCKDEEYVKYILSLGNAEAISKELETKDIDLSAKEIRNLGKLLKKKAEGELSDEELEEVSGGLFAELVLALCTTAVLGGLTAIGCAVKDC